GHVDQHRRRRQAELHQRDERVATGQELGVVAVLRQERHGLLGRAGPDVVEGCRDHQAPFAAWMAAHTRWGEAGMRTSFTPSGRRASTMALMAAWAAAMVPASPTPLAPSGFDGLGVTVWSSTKVGISAAEGTRLPSSS